MNGLLRVQALRDAASVLRYHTARTLRSQTLACHSHGVAVLVIHVLPTASRELIQAALFHDLAEKLTGDLPAPVKRACPELNIAVSVLEQRFATEHGIDITLTSHEQSVLKWCDTMELVLWCREEMEMGNRYAYDIFNRGISYLRETGPCTEEARKLFNDLAGAIGYDPIN